MYMKNLFFAEAKNKTWMKGICQDATFILGSSAGYREKPSHIRLIDSHWALKHISVKYI